MQENFQDYYNFSSKNFIEINNEVNKLFFYIKISQILDQIEEQNNQIEESYSDKMIYLRKLEEKVVERFEQERLLRKELEKKANIMIEEKADFLKNELKKEMNNRYESLENFNKIIETDIPKILEIFKEEEKEMFKNDTDLTERIIIESQNLKELVVEEKKCREETEEALLEMLKEMISTIKNQIETEKKNRY